MSNIKKLSDVTKNHEKRISALESLFIKPKKSKIDLAKRSLSDHLIELRDSGFFAQPKTAEDSHKKLMGTYPCELNRVAVALVRISERKQLRKASKNIDKKKYKAYVWQNE